MSDRERRRAYKFHVDIRRSERARWHKKHPGQGEQDLEIHHIVWRATAEKYGVPIKAINSQLNAVCVTPEFHKLIHKTNDQETQNFLAKELIRMFAESSISE